MNSVNQGVVELISRTRRDGSVVLVTVQLDGYGLQQSDCHIAACVLLFLESGAVKAIVVRIVHIEFEISRGVSDSA